LAFVAEINNPKVIYYEGYQEERKEVDLSAVKASE
jgi:hypothetical protein